MVTQRTTRLVYSLAFSLFLVPAYVVYEGTRPALVFPREPVEYVQQCYGQATSIELDLSIYKALDPPLFSTSVSDLDGRVVTTTAPTWLQANRRHRLITYKNLPVGVFNINVHTDYKLNRFAMRSHEYTLAVLNVVKGEQYACYQSASKVVKQQPE